MQVERIILNFNAVFGLRNRRRGLKRFSCFSRKRTDLSKKKLHGVCTLTKAYQYAKGERFLIFEPCRTLVDICIELLLIILPTQGKKHDYKVCQGLVPWASMHGNFIQYWVNQIPVRNLNPSFLTLIIQLLGHLVFMGGIQCSAKRVYPP